jgi:Mg2+/Co2+ transporter CorB
VDGTVPVRELNRELEWNLPDDGATTIAGLVIQEISHHPGARPAFRLFRIQIRSAAPSAQPDHRDQNRAATKAEQSSG